MTHEPTRSTTWVRLSDGAKAYDVVISDPVRFRRDEQGEMMRVSRAVFLRAYARSNV